MRRTEALTLMAALALGGCTLHARLHEPADGDVDTDVDGDVDTDTDVDTDADTDADADADLVVHEWGVFSGGEAHGDPGLWGETMADKPILYLYPAGPMAVDVTVGLPGGMARETWPERVLADTITWSGVQVDPRPCGVQTPFPEWGRGQCEDPWAHMCEATELESYTVPDAGCLTVDGVTSPLLFYAGRLGPMPEPLTGSFCQDEAAPSPGDPPRLLPAQVSLQNNLDEPLGPTFLIYRNLAGECEPWGGCRIHDAVVGTLWLAEVPAGAGLDATVETVALTASAEDWTVMPPEWLMAEEDSLGSVLRDAGLTADEAEALLAGWRHTFFDLQPDDNLVSVPMGESLTAVTLLPRSYFDDVLPIEISPEPRELVRVGLGHRTLFQACPYPDDSSSDPPEGS